MGAERGRERLVEPAKLRRGRLAQEQLAQEQRAFSFGDSFYARYAYLILRANGGDCSAVVCELREGGWTHFLRAARGRKVPPLRLLRFASVGMTGLGKGDEGHVGDERSGEDSEGNHSGRTSAVARTDNSRNNYNGQDDG